MGNLIIKKENDIPSQYTTPSGLYKIVNWDLKQIKKLIENKKLAPIFPGKEENLSDADLEECPICLLFYPGGLNKSICCKKGICTECFLQIKKPNGLVNCPFCNRSGFDTVFLGPRTKEEREKELEEQQKVIELKIKIQNEEKNRYKQQEKEEKKEISNLEITNLSSISPTSNSPHSNNSEIISNNLEDEYLDQCMLMEAIRLSLQSSTNLDGKTNKDLDVNEEFHKNDMGDDDDNEFQLALALSLSNTQNC